MIQLEKWRCVSTIKYDEICDTVFYVEGEWTLEPHCPECGEENTECLGIINMEAVENGDK